LILAVLTSALVGWQMILITSRTRPMMSLCEVIKSYQYQDQFSATYTFARVTSQQASFYPQQMFAQ
jgi:hypothetical protein